MGTLIVGLIICLVLVAVVKWAWTSIFS